MVLTKKDGELFEFSYGNELGMCFFTLVASENGEGKIQALYLDEESQEIEVDLTSIPTALLKLMNLATYDPPMCYSIESMYELAVRFLQSQKTEEGYWGGHEYALESDPEEPRFNHDCDDKCPNGGRAWDLWRFTQQLKDTDRIATIKELEAALARFGVWKEESPGVGD